MLKHVKVVEVETVKGGKMDRLVLHYVGSDNTTWKIGALAAKLDGDSREALKAAKKDAMLHIEMTKDGSYWNLTYAGTAPKGGSEAKPSYSKPYEAKKTGGGYDSLGNQIGNCITNAVNSLGEGKTTKEYQQRAEDFLRMGDAIRLNAEAGHYKVINGAGTTPTFDLSSEDDSDVLEF